MLILLFSALFIMNYLGLFIHSKTVQYIVGLIAILCWVFSLPRANKLYKTMGLVFSVIGLIIFIYQGMALVKLPLYMTENVTLLSIFFVLPFINSIVVVGRYEQNASRILKYKSTNLAQVYLRSSLVSFLLGGLLNIATLPLVISVVQKNLKKFKDKAITNVLISKSMLRGFMLSLTWSPMEIMIALSIEITHVDYLTLFPWLLFLSLTILLINMFLGKRYKSYLAFQKNGTESLRIKQLYKILSLGIFLALFIVLLVFITRIFDLGFLAAVSLLVAPYSFLWAISIKRKSSFLAYAIPVWKSRTNSLTGYMILFLSVGLFTSVLSETALLNYLQRPFQTVVETPIFLFLLIQVIFIVFALLGFHAIVTLTILGEIIKPFVYAINPISLSIVLIFSGLSPTMFSPFNISASLTGDILRINPFRIVWWNLGFAFAVSSAGTLLAIFIYYLL